MSAPLGATSPAGLCSEFGGVGAGGFAGDPDLRGVCTRLAPALPPEGMGLFVSGRGHVPVGHPTPVFVPCPPPVAQAALSPLCSAGGTLVAPSASAVFTLLFWYNQAQALGA